jgi:hypothetical protein
MKPQQVTLFDVHQDYEMMVLESWYVSLAVVDFCTNGNIR